MPKYMQVNLTVLLFLQAIPLVADTEFQGSIPLEFAEGLLNGPYIGKPTFYSDVIDSFPEFDFPEQFDLLGSADLVYTTRVILRSTLTTEEARKTLSDQLLATDFTVIAAPSGIPQSVGFILSEEIAYPLEFCHDDLGSVSASFRRADFYTIIMLDHSVAGPSSKLICSHYIEERLLQVAEMISRRNQGLRSYFPRMISPQQPTKRKAFEMTGSRSSGSEDYYETTTMIATEWSIPEIYKHFADQINTQGWELISENSAGSKKVGEWASSPDIDLSLSGTFTVQEMSESKYNLLFRLERNLYIQNTGPGSPTRLVPN